MKKYYLGDYIEDYDGILDNVDIVEEYDIDGDKYSVLRRNDGMEFVVLDYEGKNEFIWVSVGEEGDYEDVLEID
jgi:hypothetical protein